MIENNKEDPIDNTSRFDVLLRSMTISSLKELINFYIKDYSDKNEESQKLKGYSSLKKVALIEFVTSRLSDRAKKYLCEEFEPSTAKQLITDALKLITGEHKISKMQKAMVLPGGKGYKVWFKSKYGINETTIDLSMSDPKRICDCRMSKLGGFCIHQLAIYLMLINKRTCTISDIPFKVDEDWFESIKKRLDLRAAQSLFKEDPAIMLSNGYQVFINGNLVSYKWTGDYAGKKTVELPQEDLELHIAKKIVDIILKPINTKTREGTPEKIIFDSINIIEKITTNPKLVDKILKKFEIFEDPELPKNELDLQAFLKSNLKESIEDFKLQPPFKAYDGFEPFLFVSYAHKDISSVYPIIKKLNLSGINIWYDEGIPLTSDWGDILGQKIIDSQLFLSFISPHVNDSINTQKEIKYAALKNKPFISIFLKKTELSPGIEMIIQDVQGLMKYKMEDKQFYDNLINEIKKIL